MPSPLSSLHPLLRPLIAAVALGLLAPLTLPTAAKADSHCTTKDYVEYALTVCLTAPTVDPVLGGTFGGDLPLAVEASVTSPSGVAPGVRKAVFRYRGEYLLTDHDAPYGMTWKTARMVDGPGQLDVKVRLTDGRAASHVVPITLANGRTTPWANDNRFTVRSGTTPAPGKRFRLVAVGDGAAGAPVEHQVAAQIASWKPNMVAYLGDVYERGSAFEFDNWYADPQGFGQFRSITNPTVGNHEYLTPGAQGYFDHWDNVPHYYSFDVAGWHVVTIDSTGHYGQRTPGTEQYEWLAADLGANRSRCTLVYLHHPRFSLGPGGGAGALRDIWALLADRSVTLAIAGHAHRYERWTAMDRAGNPDPTGVTHMISGAGGHELSPPILSDSRAPAAFMEPGALRLDLGPDDASFAYVNQNGVELDSGTVGCKSTGDPLPPHPPAGLAAQPTTDSTAQVSWSPTTDVYGTVAGYRVWRDGTLLATLDAATTSYADSGLVTGETYTWAVDAFDDSDNYSKQSPPVSATMPAPPPPQVSSRTLFRALKTHRELRPRGFAPAKFRSGLDADADGCPTRAEVLLAEALQTPTVRPGCSMSGGSWRSAFDGVRTGDQRRLAVTPLVPLREAWASGARKWSRGTRARYANDLLHAPTLQATTNRMVRVRAGQEPREWLPPRKGERCDYVAEWVSVKWRWKLRVDRAELRFLRKRLRGCGWPAVDQPAAGWVQRH